MIKKNRFVFYIVLLITALLFDVSIVMAGARTVRVAGSTTVLPVVAKTSDMFMAIHPDVRIMVNPGGSGVGVKFVGNGLADIGMVSREITDEEIKNFPESDFKVNVVGIDAVACVVSSEIYDSGVKTLTKEQIRKIYSGEIENWKYVGGPDKEIFCIDKERHRGTRHVFMEYVFGNKNARAPGADLVSGSNNEEQTKVALSDKAIGMLSFAWINGDVKGVDIIEDGNIIAPTVVNIKNGRYPIARNLTLVTNGVAGGVIGEFIDYILGPYGQKVVEEYGYVSVK